MQFIGVICYPILYWSYFNLSESVFARGPAYTSCHDFTAPAAWANGITTGAIP
jgi:hypothetical protein